MKSKKQKHKVKIKKALERRGDEANYFPTDAVAVRWYNILNQSLFEDKLTRPVIEVKRLRGCQGQLHMDWDGRYSRKGTCDQNVLPYHNPTFGYKIELNHRFKTWRAFLETLANDIAAAAETDAKALIAEAKAEAKQLIAEAEAKASTRVYQGEC